MASRRDQLSKYQHEIDLFADKAQQLSAKFTEKRNATLQKRDKDEEKVHKEAKTFANGSQFFTNIVVRIEQLLNSVLT